MNYNELFLENIIRSDIRFDKEMKTVYDLSYFLVDFQAIINNLSEIIYDDIDRKYILLDEKRVTEEKQIWNLNHYRHDEKNELLENKHPQWQQKIERNIEAVLFQEGKAADHSYRVGSTLKQTTNRKFNKKYEMNLQLNEFSKGSLILDIANSVLVSFITDFLKALLIKQTGNDRVVNINIQNQYIIIDDSVLKVVPKNSCIEKAIQIQQGINTGRLDVQKCIHDVIEASQPDQNTEESVRRFLKELHKNGLVSEQVIYDERGIKTAARDIERFKGNFVDYSG